MILDLPDKEIWESLQKDVKDIKRQIANQNGPKLDDLIDNKEFCKRFHITTRTAQNWRDEGKISFVQIGFKVLYRIRDIHEFINSNLNKSFYHE